MNPTLEKLTSLLKDLVHCYCIVFPEYENAMSAAHRINHGECGNAAQAVGLVLDEVFGDANDVKTYGNLNHAFLLHNGLGYDVQTLNGEPVEYFNERYSDLDDKPYSQEELFNAFTYCDPLGCLFIQAFLTRHNVPVPEYLTAVIADQDDSEREWNSRYALAFKTIAEGNPDEC